MKKYLYIIMVLLVVIAAYWYLWPKQDAAPAQLLGDDPKLYLYTIDGASSGQLLATMPFNRAAAGEHRVDIALDLNQDGQIQTGEELIKNQPTYLVQNLKNNFWLKDEAKKLNVDAAVLLKINLKNTASGQPDTLEKIVKIESWEVNDLLGWNVPGASEEIKRGPGLPLLNIAAAQTDNEPIFRDARTPDLAQGQMECAAVSAANSLMSLAGANDRLGNLPEFTGDLIEELKTDMQFKNGITLENMVSGKNAFAQRHNLPISTELKFAPTKEDILNALRLGAAVELSFSFIRSASGRANTGHVVTLVGASNGQIFVHDSGTPEGMDELNMHGTVQTPKHTFINVPYPLWDGVAFVDGIVIQNWTQPRQAQESYTDSGEQGSEIEVLVINGHYFPKSFFRIAGADACSASHYHADGMVYGLRDRNSTEILSMTDPLPTACGFGKVSEVPVERITISFEQSQELARYLPN